MIKKILISLCVILVLAGLGFLGYVVFMAKNITDVQIIGNVQTVYFVGDELDFQDAELKVTYKNGDSKLISMKDGDVKVTLFSTAVETHGIMKITYKGFTLEQPYNVLATGMYYVSEKTTMEADSSASAGFRKSTVKYNSTTTYEMLYFLSDGKLMYYHYASGRWYMEDGNYDSRYKYSISGDTITINLDGKLVYMKANYTEHGDLFFTSTYETYDKTGTFLKSKVESTYTHYISKTERRVKNITVCYNSGFDSSNELHTFVVGESLDTSNIYIKVEYANDSFMPVVYVKMCNAMDANSLISTKSAIDGRIVRDLYYEGFRFKFAYRVVGNK